MQKSRSFSTKKIVFSAAAIGLATVVADFIKLPSLPFGGSITLFSMLLVSLVGYWYGPVVGISAAVAHGILQFISNPYAIHPIQVILDYPMAFGMLGLSGFFSEKKKGLILGYSVGVFGRFIVTDISGIIYFTEYVGNIQGDIAAILEAIIYNISYIVPEYVLTIILLLLPPVKKALTYIKKMAQ